MDIELEIHNINLGTIKVENDHFQLPYWIEKKHFMHRNHRDTCMVKKEVSNFRMANKPFYKNFDRMKLIKIKSSRTN